MTESTTELFNKQTQAIVHGLQENPIQRMLDYDYLCGRSTPSVAAIVHNEEGVHKAFFGDKEILIPIFSTTTQAAAATGTNASVLVNFASMRSAYSTSLEAIRIPKIKTIAIIAEGIPERRTRELIAEAKKHGKTIIGPATVGGLTAGAFRIGNTAGTIENIVESRLYRPGSVGLISKSGGLLNELFNVISRNSDGAVEGIAIGGDAFPGSTMLEHLLRYESNPRVKMLVALGELGGREEYAIAEALLQKKITKPLVIWVSGTCASVFPTEVQFGHAGAKSGDNTETAQAKIEALKKAGAVVPQSFNEFGEAIRKTFEGLKARGVIQPITEPAVPKIPLDYKKAVAEKKVRRPTNFVSSISDDRGEEVTYAGTPLSTIIEQGEGLPDVITRLWFKKKLSRKTSKFLELVLMTVADHGPAVSGAHNAIVAARAGKDLVSSLASGLLTIGPRFGGAIDDAARFFKNARDSNLTPQEFVDDMKKRGLLISGIGHAIKSTQNPDKRVELLKKYAHENWPTNYLDYALEVEKITTSKKNNLILNVDGCIAVCFLDALASEGFAEKETRELMESGFFNALFALGRSIGIIGHVLDQKRLKTRLYRHPWDDILYLK